jgi:hypothetical protein
MQFFRLETIGDLNNQDLALTSGPPEGMVMRSYTLARGKRAAPHYPKEARISLRENHPGIKLSSLLGNTHNHLVVQSAVKEVIAAHCQGLEVEYLPVDLYDHRKRLYSRDYFFINPIGSRDCLDPVASRVQIGPEGSVIHVGEYVLDPKKVDTLPALFRVQEEPSTYVVSQALADALREKGFTNVVLNPLRFSNRT